MKNFIPYVKLQTSKGTLNFLIDTGANKSYIDPKHVNLEKMSINTTDHCS